MALNPSRSASRLSRQAMRTCAQSTPRCIAPFSSSAGRRSEQNTSPQDLPRWAKTPERMKAPFSPHITKDPARSRWKVNNDPQKLDRSLNQFFGRDGEKLLPEELKWLAVTHKSFDQGRRGFNDRLAFLGKDDLRITRADAAWIDVAWMEAPDAKWEADPYAHLREPFENPELRSIDNLSAKQPADVFSHERLTSLAVETQIADIVRWKPRMPDNIQSSGFAIVMSGAVYALIGAVAMQHGGKVASRIVRERVIKRLPQ